MNNIELTKGSKAVVFGVFTVAIVRFALYIFFGINAVQMIPVSGWFSIVINLLMYFCIFKYAMDFFLKGKDVSMESMVFRYAIASVATIVGTENMDNTVMTLLLLIILFVPYFAGNLAKPDKAVKLMIIVLIASIAVSVLRIMNPENTYLYEIGHIFYYLDACNITVQWVLFSVLYILRGKIYKESLIQKTVN